MADKDKEKNNKFSLLVEAYETIDQQQKKINLYEQTLKEIANEDKITWANFKAQKALKEAK